MSDSGSPEPDDTLPRHIAVIMDGNNRWAKLHKQTGIAGHRAGATAARELVRACRKRGVKVLTLFAFSSENWERPRKEVNSLMALFISVLQKDEISELHEHNIRVRFIGRRDRFNRRLQRLMHDAEQKTASNSAMTVVVAADYGGRWDITQAAASLAVRVAAGELTPAQFTENLLGEQLALADLPEPDLCIRTAGEQRISNFLLWQLAYAELYFSPALWPDFNEEELDTALRDYSQRQRRFGKSAGQMTGDRGGSC